MHFNISMFHLHLNYLGVTHVATYHGQWIIYIELLSYLTYHSCCYGNKSVT